MLKQGTPFNSAQKMLNEMALEIERDECLGEFYCLRLLSSVRGTFLLRNSLLTWTMEAFADY
jgi:hypothetical protein